MTKIPSQIELIPPYCPNSSCPFHFGDEAKFYVKNGWTSTDRPPYKNQRFKCKFCKTQFSANTFGLDFRKKVGGLSERILHYSMNGMSNNSIARLIKSSEGTVRNRLTDMSRQALIFAKGNYPKTLKEDIVYDGFETFTHSQFQPCYINTAVGKHSHFIYSNTFSPLNRKGRMSDDQKIKNRELIKKYGLYPRDSIYQETCYILKNLASLGGGRTLYTDEHKAYQRAVRSFDCPFDHETISSEVRRDPSNPLFAVNRLHLLYRHFFSSQHRETISFQKHEAALMEKMQIMKIYRNFMNPKFVKKNKFDPHAHEWSPAMYAEVAEKILSFDEIFGVRKMKGQVLLDDKERDFMMRKYSFSRQEIAG